MTYRLLSNKHSLSQELREACRGCCSWRCSVGKVRPELGFEGQEEFRQVGRVESMPSSKWQKSAGSG